MATATSSKTATVARGFAVPCLKCGEVGSVRVTLHDLDQFSCTECDADWSADDVRNMMDRWFSVLAWLDMAPAAD